MICYKIINLINNKVYIGITKNSITKRWNEHKSKSKTSNSHLSKSIRKYGVENFKIHILKEFDNEQQMYDYEIEAIKKYKSTNHFFGYNNSEGGEKSSKGKKLSEETKKKISEYQKKRKRTKHSEETRKKQSESAKGRDMSKAVKSSADKRRGKPSHNRVCVYQFDLENNFIKKFNSLSEAAKSVNGVTSAFSALKRKTLKTYKGYTWKF